MVRLQEEWLLEMWKQNILATDSKDQLQEWVEAIPPWSTEKIELYTTKNPLAEDDMDLATLIRYTTPIENMGHLTKLQSFKQKLEYTPALPHLRSSASALRAAEHICVRIPIVSTALPSSDRCYVLPGD